MPRPGKCRLWREDHQQRSSSPKRPAYTGAGTSVLQSFDRRLSTSPATGSCYPAGQARYIRDQLMLLIQTVQHCHPDIAQQALSYCLQAGTKGAADFKAVVRHFCDQTHEKQEPSAHLNPLNRKTPIEALIQPHASSINDYDMF
jgi:hypothetical protein